MALVLGVFLIWIYPRQAATSLPEGTSAVERHQVENSHRSTGAQVFLGIGLLIGVWLTHRRVRAVEKQAESAARQAETAEQGQITERFTRAIEQLGKSGDESLAIRLGGIYSLERLMRDSADDFSVVQEVLAAFVRNETAPLARTSNQDAGQIQRPRTDVQAALTVLGRNRPTSGGIWDPTIDLSGAYLCGASLERAHLEFSSMAGTNLSGANLESAHLVHANLEGINLMGAQLEFAHLQEADLTEAQLQDSNLMSADLSSANLERTVLDGANLNSANLEEAYLVGATLAGATLSGATLEGSKILDANLKGADLRRVKASGVHLERANLTMANLQDANLAGANLEEADLTGANLKGAQLSGAKTRKTRGLYPVEGE